MTQQVDIFRQIIPEPRGPYSFQGEDRTAAREKQVEGERAEEVTEEVVEEHEDAVVEIRQL